MGLKLKPWCCAAYPEDQRINRPVKQTTVLIFSATVVLTACSLHLQLVLISEQVVARYCNTAPQCTETRSAEPDGKSSLQERGAVCPLIPYIMSRTHMYTHTQTYKLVLSLRRTWH